jgi:hypothetical protein
VAVPYTSRRHRRALSALVIGGMIEAGAPFIAMDLGLADATPPFGAVIACCIAAAGTYAFVRMFEALAERNLDLGAAVCAYARAGFGDIPIYLKPFVINSPPHAASRRSIHRR